MTELILVEDKTVHPSRQCANFRQLLELKHDRKSRGMKYQFLYFSEDE